MSETDIKPPPRMRGSTISGDHELYTGLSLPRACGDRPGPPTGPHFGTPPPPRMRGSTCDVGEAPVWAAASPAHAGIDPVTVRGYWMRQCLPRACGDRPRVEYIEELERGPPPRMRGSTWPPGEDRFHVRASPAHAGIDPTEVEGILERPSLPRACGDRPPSACSVLAAAKPPPRMRGSTLALSRAEAAGSASPAHAGIDLRWSARSRRSAGLPRACGDRPDGIGGRHARWAGMTVRKWTGWA